jgi:hypothetical protein
MGGSRNANDAKSCVEGGNYEPVKALQRAAWYPVTRQIN